MADTGPEAAQPTDDVLIQRVKAGEREAFDLLYARYFPRVYSYVARRISNRADTEETVQEVFLSVFSSLDSFRAEGSLAAWVLGVARFTVANRYKKRRHTTVPLEETQEAEALPVSALGSREATPLEHLEGTERIERLSAAARDDLSSEQRELFVMHHLRHTSIHDIAHTLRKSEDAVKSNLYRARKLLLAR
ncbi:MAG: sigma-70 family RNA polymerase sigma factor [Myxococcota bacterium]|nr:sigma-70 family RNA polymerase sigma factor [Myxococcota bacterium]